MKYILQVISLLFLFSCSDEVVESTLANRGLDFFPIKKNTYKEYMVNETEYAFTGEIIERNYFIPPE